MALTFKVGDLEAVVDTTLTASAAMRTQGADERSFIPGVSAPYSGNTQVFPDAGDIYSSPLSALVDLELKKDDYGLFSRVSYTYDYTIKNQDCDNCFRPTPVGALDGISGAGQNLAGNKLRVLDLFAHGTWHPSDHLLNLRVGKQVVNWGKATSWAAASARCKTPSISARPPRRGPRSRKRSCPRRWSTGSSASPKM